MKKIIVCAALIACSLNITAQNKKTKSKGKPTTGIKTITVTENGVVKSGTMPSKAEIKTKGAPAKAKKMVDNGKYVTLNPVLKYSLVKGKNNGPTVKNGDFIVMEYAEYMGDSCLGGTYQQGKPALNKIQTQDAAGDISKVVLLMCAGDSASIKMNPDSIFKNGAPPFYKQGSDVRVTLKVIEIKPPSFEDSMQAEQAKMQAMQKQQMMEANKELAVTQGADILKYATDKSLKLQQTASGLQYVITQEGSGPNVPKGSKVTMNYTGSTLDGKNFDSNILPEFNHVQPFEFQLGVGQVIPGWDEGIALLRKGSKATLLIPSYLAYGENGAGGAIGPNAILRFDVEVVDFK